MTTTVRTATRPRVLLCVDEFKAGGVTVVMTDLATALRDDYDVHLAALRPGAWHERVIATGVRTSIVGPASMARLMRRADLVHSHSRGIGLLAVAAGRRARSIEHVHNFFRDQRMLSFRGGTVIAVSNAIGSALTGDYAHLRRATMHVVRNAAPDALLQRTDDRVRPDTLHVVAVGRLDEQKDPLAFLTLADALRRREPGFRATWVGDGPLASAFAERIQQLRLEDTVTWEAQPDRQRTLDLIAGAAVFALTSRWEGFPLVVLEAMAVGTPIVTTPCGDMTEVVEEHRLGAVLRGDPDEPGAAEDWASQVQALWSDEQRWLSTSSRARDTAHAHFSMATLRRAITTVYDSVLGRPSARATLPLRTVQVGPFSVVDAASDEVVERIAGFTGTRAAVFALHVGGLNLHRDAEFLQAMRCAELVHADGAATVLIGRLAGARRLSRAATTDIGLPVLRRVGERLGRPARVALIGGAPGVAKRAALRIEAETGAVVVHATHGFHDDYDEQLGLVDDARPDVVIVGMGMPREACWVAEHLERLPETLVITCGGWFGFLAGVERRAPVLLQRLGLEWVARIVQAPVRLGPRYVRGVGTVLSMVWKELSSGVVRRR